jgi:hypothetical protein
MKITNPTHWNTRDIARLIYRVAEDELDQGQLKRARVRIRYMCGRNLGYCTYGSLLHPCVIMTLRMPRPGNPVDTVQLAKVIAHELGHAKGLRHSDMRNPRYGWVDGWRDYHAYAADFPIGVKPVVSADEKLAKRRADAIVKAQKMVGKWTTASKRANTMLKKWSRRLKIAQTKITKIPPSSVY